MKWERGYLNMSNRKNKKNKKKPNIDINEYDLSTLLILPYVSRIGDGTIGYLLKNNVHMNVFRIKMHDFYNEEENYVVEQAAQWDMFYRTYKGCSKTISFKLPIDVSSNISYFKRKIKKTTNPIYKRILNENIENFSEAKDKEVLNAYLFIFADSIDKLNVMNNQIYNSLCASNCVQLITVKEKESVINRINNPYSYEIIS